MGKGRDLSRYQEGVVRRYYEHRDTIATQRLAEIVSDLYVTDSPRQVDRLWDRAGKALAAAGVEPARVTKLLADRNVQQLATLVGELSAKKPK